MSFNPFLNSNSSGDFSGDYNDLINKPTIPTVSNDLTDELKEHYDLAYNQSHTHSNMQALMEITDADITALHSTFPQKIYEIEQSLSDYATKEEVTQARVDANGTTYSTLKERLDSTDENVESVSTELKEDLAEKINKPTSADNNKFPRAKDGNIEWVEQGLPTDEQTANAVHNWLNEHPEATTTVMDGSITNAKIQDKTIEFNKIKYFYNTFPDDSVILELPDNTYFETKGFYSVGDGGHGCYWLSKGWLPNSFKISDGDNQAFIKPLSNENNVDLIKYGLKEGSDNANLNDTVINRLVLQFGCVLVFPSGHYYFNSGIDVTNKQISIKGAGCTFSNDVNTTGNTWLHFPNIPDGGFAIKQNRGFISDIVLVGNRDKNYVKIDRSKTYIAPNEIATIVNTTDTKGLYITSSSKINNVSCMFFRYGIYCEIGNIFIHDVSAKFCNIGLSIKNDTKCVGVYGFDVGILLQINGSIASAVQVRGDAISEHLVQIINGSGIYLSDLDADYCVGSCLKIGNNNNTYIRNLFVNGIHGRCGCSVVYDSTKDSPVTALDLTESNLHLLPLVSVDSNTKLIGAHITGYNNNSNPLDAASNYYTTKVLICSGANSYVNGVHFETTEKLGENYSLDSDYLKELARSLSDNTDNENVFNVDINSPYGRATITQSGDHNSPQFHFTKYVTESV